MENHKWAPPGAYQPAMNLYLGTDSSNDKGGWFTSSYRSIIQCEQFRSRCPMQESLRIHTKANYQRIRLGLLGGGSKKPYYYWWYCPDICSKGPMGTSWSLYWFNGVGPVRHQRPRMSHVLLTENADDTPTSHPTFGRPYAQSFGKCRL